MKLPARLLPAAALLLALALLPAACASPSGARQTATPVAAATSLPPTISLPPGIPATSVALPPATPVARTPATPVAPPPTLASALPTPVVDRRPVMVADHAISVLLRPEERSLTASQRITYRNAAAKPFDEMILHLYLNAFKSPDTVFMVESGGALRGHEFDPTSAGSIEITAARLASGAPLRVELLEDGTLARLRLPAPVAPGEEIALELAFTARLPRIFARTGWATDGYGDPFFLVAQWFPKPGVWTDAGWQAEVFHGNAEFFADFGRYAVEITLPEEYVTGATGVRQGAARPAPGGMQTVRYDADGVIDFAWVASPNLRAERREAAGVPVEYLYFPEHAWSVQPTFESAEAALSAFSDWFGPYPYPRLTIVDVPEGAEGAGGMEYPSFITVGAGSDSPPERRSGWQNYLEVVTVHEIAHQWWQSVVATDEGREPWLDEGFADFSTMRLMAERYGLAYDGPERRAFAPGFLENRRRAFLRAPDLPMLNEAWDTPYNLYVVAAYAKPALALMTLENHLGPETMLRILSTYYDRHRFAHPTTADFERIAVEISGEPLDWFFDELVRSSGKDMPGGSATEVAGMPGGSATEVAGMRATPVATGTINWRVKSIAGRSVTVEREGAVALPAEVLVTLANGAAQERACPAEKTSCVFTFDAPVLAVEIDPERKVVIDLDWADNSLRARPAP